MSQNNKVILVTGVTGSGKTTLIDFLKNRRDVQTWKADEFVREMYETSFELKSFIEKEFPTCIDKEVVDKNTLGKIVFSNVEKLNNLNNFIQPLIKKGIEEVTSSSKKTLVELKVYLDYPNIYGKMFYRTIFLYSDKKNVEKRIRERFKHLEEASLNELIQKNIKQQEAIINKKNCLEKDGWIFLDNSSSLTSLKDSAINILNKI